MTEASDGKNKIVRGNSWAHHRGGIVMESSWRKDQWGDIGENASGGDTMVEANLESIM